MRSALAALLVALLAATTARAEEAFVWRSSVDTDLSFDRFYDGDFTIRCRFLLQYPVAYTGPILAENGTGTFLVAQADFNTQRKAQLLIDLGGSRKLIAPDPPLEAGRWVTLALTRRGDASVVVVDGKEHEGPRFGPDRPRGTLRLGRRTDGRATDGQEAQFFGRIDGLAISPEVPWRRTAASTVESAELPLPALKAPLRLPFPPGQTWAVIQGCGAGDGSHRGYAAFCWDFVLAGRPQSESKGLPFQAAAAGDVTLVVDENEGPAAGNWLMVKHADGEYAGYLHFLKKQAKVAKGARVAQGDELAATGDTGCGAGAYHLHFALSNLEDGRGGPFVTIPAAFDDYEVSEDEGKTWTPVKRGVPRAGQWVRRPAR